MKLAYNYETARFDHEKKLKLTARGFASWPNWMVLARNLTFFLWPVSSETGEKCLNFFCFLAQKMKLAVVSCVKLTKIMKPARFGLEKYETDGTLLRRGRQFQFFS